ncbi:cupin domain-containing protein [Dactylosporangium sp. NPDC048998]|uniref:cupin domain-containing protein n=1 Tax=Dactylosporangium sp. NPDC048998 TaxID=3363976 RepID=UPI00371CDFFC
MDSHAGTPVAVQLPAAGTAELGPAVLKPTSRTGQRERTLELWTDSSGAAEAGVWECEPGEFTARRNGYTEVCHILSGSATVVDANGHRTDLRPGDLLVQPDGWEGTWTVHETMRKTYAIIPAGGTPQSG